MRRRNEREVAGRFSSDVHRSRAAESGQTDGEGWSLSLAPAFSLPQMREEENKKVIARAPAFVITLNWKNT